MRFRSTTALVCALLFAFTASAQKNDSATPKQRISLIRSLGNKGPQAIPVIERYLRDPDSQVRVEAVKAIVKLDTPASLTPLIEATRDQDPEIQIRATDGLVNEYLPGYVVTAGLTGSWTRGMRQVKAFFKSRNNQTVSPQTKIRPDVAEALVHLIEASSDDDVQANAARAAGILRARAAVPALEQALHSTDSETITEALVALQKIGDRDAGPSVSFLALDLDPNVQDLALQTIGILRTKSSAPQVRTALNSTNKEKTRRSALNALAILGLSADRPVFLKYERSSDPVLRVAALEGLGRIREPKDVPVLQAAYNEKNAHPLVHLAAAFALVDEGDVSHSEFAPLTYLIENLNQSGRADTAKAYLIELCRREDVRKGVFAAIPQASKDQKIALCSIFAAVHARDSVPVLESLSHNMDPDVSFAATKALQFVKAHSA
ncbi:MAG TPA: HEAT repeat domain-containing protein [Bryobacteraceae bacterium]